MSIMDLGVASKETKAIDPSLQTMFDGNPPLPPGKLVLGRIYQPF